MSAFIDRQARRVLRTTAQAWRLPTPLRVRGVGPGFFPPVFSY